MKNYKYILLIIFIYFIPAFMFARKKNKDSKILSPTGKKMDIRPCDPAGCGYFGANRIGHVHQGVDVIIKAGDAIYAPISGNVRRLQVYRNNPQMKGLEISGADNVKIKIFYVDVYPQTGEPVKAGDFIGYAQDIAGYYNNPSMTPHIHVEVRKNGNLINPEEYFKKLIA